jgi:hypothetical protein
VIRLRHAAVELRRGKEVFGGQSIQPELFSNRAGEAVLDFGVARDRSSAAIFRICVKIVVGAVPLEIATLFDQSSDELPSLHSEMAISSFSLGTNVFSAASSTISRYASRIMT